MSAILFCLFSSTQTVASQPARFNALAYYALLAPSSSNAQIRQRRAVAKADHLCIDLLSQLAAEQWFGFPELQMAL